MKKFLILFFILFSPNLFAKDVNYKQSIKLHKDVMTGYNTKWSATCTYTDDNKCLAPDYAYNVVDKKDNYPVRIGNKSLRFELRSGDCHQKRPGSYNDCKATPPAERHEFSEEWDKTTVSRAQHGIFILCIYLKILPKLILNGLQWDNFIILRLVIHQ